MTTDDKNHGSMINGWPLRRRFWKRAHGIVNALAWRYARPDGPEEGIALRIDNTRLLWRLNSYCADGWARWHVQREVDRMAAEREAERPFGPSSDFNPLS